MEHKDACTNSIGFQSGSNLRQDGMLGPLGSVVRRLQRVRLGRKLRGTQSHSSSVTTCSCYQEVSAPAKAAKPLPSINDVFAGGAARAAAQATIHPLDTLKVNDTKVGGYSLWISHIFNCVRALAWCFFLVCEGDVVNVEANSWHCMFLETMEIFRVWQLVEKTGLMILEISCLGMSNFWCTHTPCLTAGLFYYCCRCACKLRMW